MNDNILVFEIWGKYGMFRKYFTTSSPLSYSFPPRTTIIGIIAAMIGLNRDSYYEKLSSDKCNVSLEIVNPIDKVKFSTNYVDTKKLKYGTIDGRTRIRCEYVKNPKYRIYVNFLDQELQQKFKKILQEKHFQYTISLGISQHLANIKFVGEYKIDEKSLSEEITLHSVVRMDFIKNLKIIYDEKLFPEYNKDRMLVDFEKDNDRVPKEYQDYIYERNGEKGKCILCETDRFFKVSGENFLKNILFM